MHKLIRSIAATIFLLGMPGAALAASGTALGVDPAAEARGQSETRRLVVGSDIFIGDRVVTGASGLVQILFSDDTELVVGPRSALLIEDYLLREDGSAGKLAVNALAGTFRFVTGGSAKNRYQIKTPSGTIGVRGTAFDLYVTDRWTYGLGHEGAMIGCPRNNPADCMVLTGACQFGIMGRDGVEVFGDADNVTGNDRKKLREFFRYSVSQSPLLQKFRIRGAEKCLGATTQSVPDSLIELDLGGPSTRGVPGNSPAALP